MKFAEFNDFTPQEWDDCIKAVPESTYLHSSWWLRYLNAMHSDVVNKSFILFEGALPIAICPIAVHKTSNLGMEYMEATFGGFSSIYPAIIKLPPTQRRRVVRKVFALMDERMEMCEVKNSRLFRHPINLDVMNGGLSITNMTEGISHGYIPYVKNSVIIDLRKEEDCLMHEMSQYQRKNIRKSEKQKLSVKEYRGEAKDTDEIFDDFKSAHFNSSGRLTRPMETWDMMKDLLKKNMAVLFAVSTEEGKNISYLYCGEFHKFCFGWSQVNLKECEGFHSPRHLLEWEAMLFYKARGFYFYEIGPKNDSSQPNHIPTYKESTISQIKERYGGDLYCWLYFEKFFDKRLFETVYNDRLKNFLASNYFLRKDTNET